MINLAINGSIIKSSVSVSRKAEPASADTQKKTFQNVLSETIHKKNTLNETPDLYSTNYIFNAADTESEIVNYETEIDEETLNEVTMYAEPELQAKTLDEITKYEKTEINGIWITQMTDEYLTYLGYDVEILKANDLGRDLSKYVDKNGFAPKYIIPLDMSWDTDYAKTLATPENLAKTVDNNAVFGSAVSKATSAVNNNNIIQNNENLSLQEAVKEDHISQSNANKPSEKVVNLIKPAKNNAALRILANLNILNIWNPKEKEDEKK